MTTRNNVLYGGVAAVAVVAALAYGVPFYFLAVLLVCPLMMFFLMRGMHGGSDSDQRTDGSKPHDHASMR